MKYILTSLLSLFLFTACSGKKYYEPEDVSSNIELNKESMSSSISSMNKIGGTLNNKQVITKNGISSYELPEGFDFLNITEDGRIIATNYIDKVPKTIKDRKSRVKYSIEVKGIEDEEMIRKFLTNSFELISMKVDFEGDIKKLKNKTLDELKQYVLDKVMDIDPDMSSPTSLGFK